MSIITDVQQKTDFSTFRTPELRDIESMADVQASAELDRALDAYVEEPAFNLESDDAFDTNPAILQATQALGDAQKEAVNIRTERIQYVESPIHICEFVGKAGGAINKMRTDLMARQDQGEIDALRLRSNK